MSSECFEKVIWTTASASDSYTKLRDKDEGGAYGGGIGSTDGLIHTILGPVLISDAEKHVQARIPGLNGGEVEAIGIWTPNAFRKHTVTIAVIIPGDEIPASNRIEAIEKAVLIKAGLKEAERATSFKIISETPKYVSTVASVEQSKTSYHIIGNGIDANDALSAVSKGYTTRTEAKAELKKILSRSRSTKFNLPLEEDFEIIGISRIAKAKSELSKLAVRAKVDIVTVDPTRPRDGWMFYGVGVIDE